MKTKHYVRLSLDVKMYIMIYGILLLYIYRRVWTSLKKIYMENGRRLRGGGEFFFRLGQCLYCCCRCIII